MLMSKFHLLFCRFMLVCVLFLTFAVFPVAAEDWRKLLIDSLKPGDVVFRRGNGDISDAIAIVQQIVRGYETRWTHVGVVHQIRPGGSLYVIHALEQGVVLDTPELFFSEGEALAGSVVRGDVVVAHEAAQMLGRSFDRAFIESDGGELVYCTELVTLALDAAGFSVRVKRRVVPVGLNEPVVFPDDLFDAISSGVFRK